jgi:hypothetical protein
MKGKQGDGLADLIAELKEMPDPRLVVIDTLSLFLPEAKGNVTYAQEYDQMTEIRKVIGMFPHLSILAITHINKGENSDQFEAMYGTRGKGAGSDVQMLMIREAGQNRASLKIRGNDLADCISTLTWLPGELRWEVNDTTAAGEEGYDEAASRCKEVAQVQANRTNERKRSGPKPVKGEQARADAIALLKDGPMLSRDFKKAMKDKGHSDDAFRKAQEHLGFRVIDGHYRLPPL